jgi:ABC-type transport system substrate-binding protein
MKRKLSLLLALVLVFALVLTACGGPKEPTPGADQPGTSTPATPDTPAEPRTDLNLRLYAEPTTLDSQYSTSTYDMAVIYQIFDNLFEIGPGGYDDMQYSLCTSYEMNETAMEYVFHIREGVYVSNGDLLTAEDVAFSIKRMVESPVTSMRVYFISNVEVIDEYTVKCTLSLPCTRLPQLLSTASMTIVSKRLVEQYGSNSPEMLVGTGAYKLEKWTPGQGIVLTAYE